MKASNLLRGTMLAGLCGLASGCVGLLATPLASSATLSYPVVDTGQSLCYGNAAEIDCPQTGSPFYGQDAQYQGNQPSYTISADGKTVDDNVTGLTWQRSPDTDGDGAITYADKLTWTQAQAVPATLNAADFGGYNDWRLPTLKELYSLIDFRGAEPNPQASSGAGATPYIDTKFFGFSYGFTDQAADNTGNMERVLDAQFVTTTLYVAATNQMFGVNFADGRIKGYPASDAIGKRYFVICVRGNTSYGVNDFSDNGDGTVTDLATGLIWSQDDGGVGMNWEEALAYVQSLNAQNYLGYSDWRLPNAKELQSIVDYERAPEATSSAALDAAFNATPITNEAGQRDWAFYWTSTTHANARGGQAAVYVAFGRALGYMNGQWQDVHGAGAQRSDPKSGSAAQYPTGHGPQGDAVRIDNFVRVVRGM